MPTIAKAIVHAVKICSLGTPVKLQIKNVINTTTTFANPPGIAFFSTLEIKCPLIKSSFGTCDKKNDGTPITHIVTMLICAGNNG